MATKKPDPKVMDVSKPGESKASQSSRPIITGSGKMATDPDVTERQVTPTDPPAKAEGIDVPTARKKISPLSTEQKAVLDENGKPESGADDEPHSEGSVIGATKATEEDAGADEKVSDDNQPLDGSGSDSGAVDTLAKQAENKKNADKVAEEQIAKAAEVQKLIESRKYAVPIGRDSTKKRGGQGMLIGLLIVLIVVASGYLALDAGIIKIGGVKVPFHIIGKK